VRYARRTLPLAQMLTAVALALAGRAGARLAPLLGLLAGRSSLLRLIMALPDPQDRPVPVLGVDLSGVLSHPSVTSPAWAWTTVS
jgi:hypothetical protein